MIDENILKQRVQRRILVLSALILIGKFAAYYLTNSVGVLTDAMESIVNVGAGALSLYSLRWASKPRDKEHPFGHGKMELISSSMEGLLITMAGLMIIYEGVMHLFSPAEIKRLDVGIYIVAFSGVLNYLMGWYSIRTGKKYNSIALVAGGKHLQSDTYSTIGLVAGLLVLYFTGLAWIDCLLAFIFGGIIIVTGISILKKTLSNLLDQADEALLSEMAKVLNENKKKEWIDIHNVKVLKSGNYLYINADLTIPWFFTIAEGHRLGSEMRTVLEEKYPNRVQMMVHLDPCNIFATPLCHECEMEICAYRKETFVKSPGIALTTFVRNEVEDD